MLEDVASGRGLAEKYNKITGKHLSAEEISEQARRGDRAALSLYAYMGECLGEALNKRTDEDGIDAIILGGQVSRSAELFVPRLREKVKIPVYVSQHIQDASLYGAAEISDDPD